MSAQKACAGGYYSAAVDNKGDLYVWGLLGKVFKQPTNFFDHFGIKDVHVDDVICGYYNIIVKTSIFTQCPSLPYHNIIALIQSNIRLFEYCIFKKTKSCC